MKNIGNLTIPAILLCLVMILPSCAPSIPHTSEGRKECVTCHGQNGVKPFPEWHAKDGFGNNACADCHDSKNKSL